MCPKSNDEFIEIPSSKLNNNGSLVCNLCQYLVNYLDAVIKSNATETEIEHALDRACKILPTQKVQTECETFVNLYTDDMIKFLVELDDPKKVCEALGVCDK
jgi:saposin